MVSGNLSDNVILVPATLSIKRRLEIELKGSGNVIALGVGSSFVLTKIICRRRDNLVLIGPRCSFTGGTIFADGPRTSIVIGADTTFASGVLIAQEADMHIIVGDDCMFSNEVALRTSDSHGIQELASGHRVNPPGPIVLGEHVWVGNSARVGKGVTVGSNTILAQRALLVADAEPNSIYGGVPARKLRDGITWSRAL
ncbi:MAG: hypothetical protein AB7F78_18495 [Hyphomicrobiaceae bacterium]